MSAKRRPGALGRPGPLGPAAPDPIRVAKGCSQILLYIRVVLAGSALPLTPLEIASGIITGRGDGFQQKADWHQSDPRVALEEVIRDALSTPPALVAFSGGRDSSAVLAVATWVARKEGLGLPVPVTNLFPSAPDTDETQWQEMIIRHLELPDWLRLGWEDELDLLGPMATQALRRHGLLWPPNTHFMAPLLEPARGGSLITGVGGDEMFGWWPWARAASVLAGASRPEIRDVFRVGLAYSPAPVKRWVLRRRSSVCFPWLTPRAQSKLTALSVVEDAAMPVSWARRVRWLTARRYLEVNLHSMRILADDARASMVHPFLDDRFVESLATAWDPAGFATRTRAMAALFGDLLPEEILERGSKSSFDSIFWNRHARSFAKAWDGTGVDGTLVDIEKLRGNWLSSAPDGRSATLLQAAWLTSAHGGIASREGPS
jgi:Asparagine synthase